ncbi:MAG TPA: hypothetical protein VLM40_18530, partial [Gemmata sp.]|nr:hypothetical protein [Gemmata sp.]
MRLNLPTFQGNVIEDTHRTNQEKAMANDPAFSGRRVSRRSFLSTAAYASASPILLASPSLRGQEKKADNLDKRVDEAVAKGLEWLKKNRTGEKNWAASGGAYPTSMTALAGMAFLMEGSTLKEGKYSHEIQD